MIITGSSAESSAAIGLDHVGVVTGAGEAVWGAFERLGFQLTPFSRHSGRERADGPIELMGTGNRCAMLRRGYLELLAIVDAALPVNRLDRLLRRYEGVHILALTIEDEAAALDRLRRAGIDVPGVMHLERRVDAADAASPMAQFSRLPLADAPEARVQLIRHLTPEAIWQERWMTHPNQATALEAAILAAERPAESAARFSRLAGLPVMPDEAGGFALAMPQGRVRILSVAALARVLPGVGVPCLPFLAGFVIGTADAAASVRGLVPGLVATPDGWMAQAGGTAVVFR